MAIIYTKHAEEMLILRRIKKELASKCASNPDTILPAENDNKIYLKDFGKNYLKLVISEEGSNKIIITVHWLDKKRVKQ